jgi:hypothetical protein
MRKRFVASVGDCTAVAIRRVTLAGTLARLASPVGSRSVATAERRFALRVAASQAFRFGVAGPKAISLGVTCQLSQQHGLPLGADEDHSVPAMVLGLV